MRQKKATLTDQELEIMKIVWSLNEATVRDVYEKLLERRKIAYTTVMTMMNILEQKKYLRKSAEDRAYIYRPTKPKKQVIQGMVREFVDRILSRGNSADPAQLFCDFMEIFAVTPSWNSRDSLRHRSSRTSSSCILCCF